MEGNDTILVMCHGIGFILAGVKFSRRCQAEGTLGRVPLQEIFLCLRVQSFRTLWIQLPVNPGGPLTWKHILKCVFGDF